MEYQLRRFRIASRKLDEFIYAWKAGVVARFGFQIHGAWSIEESNEFGWVISYDGPEGFDAADAAYYSSEGNRSDMRSTNSSYVTARLIR